MLLVDDVEISMQIIIGLFSSLFILMSAPFFGLAGIWSGLILFMGLRVIAGFWRFALL